MTLEAIKEIDVVIGTSLWLHSRGWKIDTISVPKGQGIDYDADKEKLMSRLAESNVGADSYVLRANGPDIIARLDSMLCKIECKGFGDAKQSTFRNNFDRAVASAIACFDSQNNLRVGVALAWHPNYQTLIDKRIPKAVRDILNLWVLIYIADTNSIVDYSNVFPQSLDRNK
jgi:hypothetical protein